MSGNSGKDKKDKNKIPKKDRARARRAARALRGGNPGEEKSEALEGQSEPEMPVNDLVNGGNSVEGDLPDPYPADGSLDPNEDPLARPSTRGAGLMKPPANDEKPDEDIPAGRSAKAAPMKPIKLPNDDYGPHAGLGD